MLDFALLAPVPLDDLTAGEAIAATTGHVAFGSLHQAVFARMEALRGGQPVQVLIYASDENAPDPARYRVTWGGHYIGFAPSPAGAAATGQQHRPTTRAEPAAGHRDHGAIVWHVAGLSRLTRARRLTLSSLEVLDGGWLRNEPLRAPALIALPAIFAGPPPLSPPPLT